MAKWGNKESLFIAGAVIAIVILGSLILNIDRLFPAPELDLKVSLPKMTSREFDVSRGTNPQAQVDVIEFGDFECPFCRQNLPEVMTIRQGYEGKINFVF